MSAFTTNKLQPINVLYIGACDVALSRGLGAV